MNPNIEEASSIPRVEAKNMNIIQYLFSAYGGVLIVTKIFNQLTSLSYTY